MKVQGCFCTDKSVHAYDGFKLSDLKDKQTAEAIMKAYIMTLHTHQSFTEKSTELVSCVILQQDDVVDTHKIQINQLPRDSELLKGVINLEHPFAHDGKHVIVFVYLKYGQKFSKATGFIPIK